MGSRVAALIVLCVAQYATILTHPLLWDARYQVEDPHIRSLRNVPGFFLETSDPPTDDLKTFTYYRPVVRALLALQFSFFGTDARGYHAVSILLHALVVIATFLLVDAVCGDRRVAFAAAALCAVSPARAATVNWVACQSTLVMAGCCCLGLYAYCRGRYFSAAIALLIALFAREDAVLFPVCLLVYEILVPSSAERERLLKLTPYLVLVVVFLAIRAAMVGAPPPIQLSATMLLNSAAVITARFLKLMVFPDAGMVVYPQQTFAGPTGEVLVSYGVVAAWVLGIVLVRRVRPVSAFWLAWVLVWLVPSAYVGQLGRFLMGMNWLYLASTGVCVLVATAALRLPRGALVVAGLACLCFVMTYRSSGYWSSPISFFERAVEFAPADAEFRYELGRVYSAEGDHARALAEFSRAVELEPTHWAALNNLGAELVASGRLDEALTYFARAAALGDGDGKAHHNLGVVLLRQGRAAEAVPHLQAAARIMPGMASVHHLLGTTLGRLGQAPEALAALERAVLLDPNVLQARLDLATALIGLGRRADAIEHLTAATHIDPGSFAARLALGVVLGEMGREHEALAQYAVAVRIRPDDASAHNEYGIALANVGRLDEAVREFSESLRLDPDQPGVAENRARALQLQPSAR